MEKDPGPTFAPDDPSEEIAALVLKLQQTQQRLQELTGGEIDAVLYPGGQAYLFQAAQEKLRQSEAAQHELAVTQASILNALPAHIALIDHEGVVLSVNDGWRGFAESGGLQSSTCGVGQNYLEICEQAEGKCAEEAIHSAAGIRAVLTGAVREFSVEYPCHSPTEQRWFQLMVAPLGKKEGHPVGAAIMHIDITERKVAEETVRAGEERFRNMFLTAATGIAVSTPEGRFLNVNASYCRMLGYTEKELLELNFASLTHPDDLALNLKLRDELLAGKRESFFMEKRYLKKNGDIVWTRHSVSATHAVGGEIATLMVIAEDITERKVSEEQLLWKTAMLEAMVHSALDGITLVDTAGQLILRNQRAIDMWDVPASITGQEDLAANLAWISSQIKNHAEYDEKGIFLINHPDESGIDEIELLNGKVFERYSHPIKDKDGKHYGRIWALRDITGRKRAEEELLRRQTELQVLFDLTPAMLCFKDTENVFLRVNQRLADSTGKSIAEIEGKSAAEIFPGEAAKYYADDLEVIASGAPKLGIVEKLQTAGGNELWVQTDKVPVSDKAGKVIGIFVMVRDITERRRIEEHLLWKTALFEAQVHASLDGIAVMDNEDKKIIHNQQLVDLWNIPPDIAAETGNRRRREWLTKQIKNPEKIVEQLAYLQEHPDGIIRDEFELFDGRIIDRYSAPVIGEDGKHYGRIWAYRDITNRKRAEEKLALFRQLIEGSPDAIEVIEPETGRYVDVNETGCQRLGYSREEMLSLRVADIDIEKDYKVLWPVVVEEIKKVGFATIIGRHRRKDGSTFPVEVNARYINLNRGYMIAVVRDITERQRTEARLRRLVDSNVQGVFFWNTKGDISDANDALLGMVGYTREDLEAGRMNWAAMTPPELIERDQRALDECAAKGVCEPYEKEYLRKDGSRVPVLIGAAMFDDKPEDGVCFVVDLSERKKLEAQFLRAQRMESIGTLAGGVAHDLNNILAPIMMSIDILKGMNETPQAVEILETIEVSAKRGADIVRQVLSFARGVEGQRVEVEPKHLLKDLENIIKDTFPKNIHLRFSLPNKLWTILGDPTQVHQVLLNLCVNARDAMPHGGNLIIGVENTVLDEHYSAMNLQAKPGRFVKISVTDSGTGIPQEIIDKIFEPFFTTKELNKGTGLGLSTLMAIVKSHEGIVNVYSEPGKGTTFNVYLPAAETSPDAGKERPTEASLPRGKGETVLVVDDEAAILNITQRTLQAFGYKVMIASDGAEALAVYAEKKHEIAVVLTDMMMPVMDGSSLIRVLTRMNPAIKIVAASGLSTNRSGNKAPGPGVKHFLTKPYTAETLLKTLRAILDET